MKIFISFLLTISFFTVSFAQENGGPYTADENTVLLMHFDGNETNSASVGNSGIIHGSGISYETGIYGQSLHLDNSIANTQSWIEVPFYNELNFTDEFSIECWFKINSWGDDHNKLPFILKKGEGWPSDYEILLNEEFLSLSANMNCIDDEFNRGADVRTTDIIETGKWYHIAIYFNFSHHHFYMVLRDENFNEFYASHNYAYTQAFCSNENLYIGFGGGNDTYFDGFIDELRISNKYLKLRDDVVSAVNTSELKDSVPPLLQDKWKVYQWPFFAYFPKNLDTGELHKGNSCGMTALMRLIHYWEHPRFPVGNIDFIDQNFHWLADFDNTEYRFDEMPFVFEENPTEEEYSAAATMVAQVGAAGIKYSIGGGGAPIKTILEKYFLFNKNLRIVYREEYSKEEWENIFKNELSNGRPILIEGTAERYDNGNWAGHFYICDGYSADNKFHTDLSIGDIEWWTDIDNFEYGKNQCALIYAEPEWNGKTLELVFPKGGEYLKNQSEIQIKWNSTNIQNVLLEYSSDAGKNWQTIAENLDAQENTFLWDIPEVVSNDYKIRISDTSDGNIYTRSKTFNVFNKQEVSFEYPKKNTYFQGETNQPIYWKSIGIPAFKLEFSTNQKDWQLLYDSILSVSGLFNFNIPDINDDKVILKATSLLDENIFFFSEEFRVLSNELVGGVYANNDKTVLLLHFEEDILNAVQNNVIPEEKSVAYKIFEENYNLNLGKAFRINNTMDANWHCLRTPHTEELNLGNNWTVETWVKYNDIGTAKTQYPLILEKAQSFGIWLDGNGNGFGGYAQFNDQSEAGFFQNQHLEKNKWYHVAITSDSNTRKVKFYVHNEHRKLIFEDSRNFPLGNTGELNHSTNDLFIGGVDGGSNVQFDGWIDEFRITKEPVNYSSMITKMEAQNLSKEMLCYPNPLTESSVIQFSIVKNDNINLSIFDIQRRKICTLLNKNLNAGTHTIPIKNQLKTNGVYLCKLVTSEGISTLKLIVNN